MNKDASTISKTTTLSTSWLCNLYLTTLLIPVANVYASKVVDESILAGKEIYRHGKLLSGDNLVATTIGDVKLNGEQAACVNCHRHSGLGSTEGSTIAPAITGEILFSEHKIKAHRYQPNTKQSSSSLDRPAYTKDALRNTLLSGVDVNGVALNRLMPHYAFSNEDYENLHAYLNSLSINDDGVTDSTLHIATIIDERVSPKKISTLLHTLERYLSDLNSNSRHEAERSAQAPIQKEWQYQGYRTLKLHVWKLSGEPETWQQQLEQHYRKTPVFAVATGISKDSWKSVDAFCNKKELPCILPTIKTPGYSINNFYTLYYNAGPYNDASVIANYYNNSDNETLAENILQLHDTSSYSIVANDTLLQGISSNANISINSIALDSSFNAEKLRSQLDNKKSTVMVWAKTLNSEMIDALSENKNSIQSVFIPYYLATSMDTRKAIESIGIPVLTAYPFVNPDSEVRATIRSSLWARSRKIDLSEKEVFTNTFTAINLLVDAIKHVRSHFNRAYIIELLEHMLDKAVLTGMYPKLSIGPGQRYSSRGGFIMKVPAQASLPLQAQSPWLLPEKQVKLTEQ